MDEMEALKDNRRVCSESDLLKMEGRRDSEGYSRNVCIESIGSPLVQFAFLGNEGVECG